MAAFDSTPIPQDALDVPAADQPLNREIKSRHRQTVMSAFALFAVRVLAAIFQLRIVERIWGGQYSGLNALSNQVLLYVTLLELGLAQSAIALLYKPIIERDYGWCAALVNALRRDARRMALFGLLAGAVALTFYAHMVSNT